MGTFENNDDNNKISPDFPFLYQGGSSGPAPKPSKSGASENDANKFGVTYPDSPDFENAKSTSTGFDDFEYGDDSVAGEYDVKESSVFKYGEVATSETIGAYYGNEMQNASSNKTRNETYSETRIDRYAKDIINEEDNIYGYETVPEIEETLPEAEVVVNSNEEISEPKSESQSEVNEEKTSEDISDKKTLETTTAELEFKPGIGEIIEERHESQAYDPDLGKNLFGDIRERRTREDPILPTFETVLTEDPKLENMNFSPMRGTSFLKVKLPTWSVVVCLIAFFGIVFVYGSALYFDMRKVPRSNSGGYVPPTTKEEATTAAEETSEATGTPTPTQEITATPTPEPTETPTPTPSPSPAPKQTQVYWPVAKKATPTPTPVATEGNSGESGTGEGGTGSEGTGGSSEGGSSEGGSSEGGNNSGDTNNGSTDTGNGQEGSGSGNGSSSGDNNTSNNNGNTSDNGGSSSSGSDSGSGNNGQQDNNDSN